VWKKATYSFKKESFCPDGFNCNKHDRVIGENLTDGCLSFTVELNTVIVKVIDLIVGKTGITEREAKELGYGYITVVTAGHDKCIIYRIRI